MTQQILKQENGSSQIISEYKKRLIQNLESNVQLFDSDTICNVPTREYSISQIIRTCGRQFRQIRKQYTDGYQGRCVMGVIMSYYGWDGKCISNAERRLYAALTALRRDGINKELLIELNDSGATFDEIADYLEKIQNR